MLEIQLPAIYRARSTAPASEHPLDDGSGLPESRMLTASLRRLRTVPAIAPTDEDDLGFGADLISVGEDDVSIDELLVWERTEEKRPIDTRIARLASLVGIAAAAIALLILVLVAGTDVASVFRSPPGS